jgi:hypothetical protein
MCSRKFTSEFNNRRIRLLYGANTTERSRHILTLRLAIIIGAAVVAAAGCNTGDVKGKTGPGKTAAAEIYVSLDGNDANPGTQPAYRLAIVFSPLQQRSWAHPRPSRCVRGFGWPTLEMRHADVV